MKLTITTLVIVEGSYIQGIFHSLEEHPGKAYQELVDQVENEYGYDADKDHVPLHFKEDFTWLIEIFATMTDNTDTYDFATFDKEATNGEPPYPVIEINRKGLANFLNDDQYYDYSPSQVEAILFGILQLTPEHQDIIVIDLKKHLKSFIQDKDQAEEMITQYTCYYNAIKRWESNHKETEILHQLEISNLLEQLKNN